MLNFTSPVVNFYNSVYCEDKFWSGAILEMCNNITKSKDLSILVYSCHKNSDMWGVFIYFFNLFWTGCVYNLILLTDRIEADSDITGFDDVVVLDKSWYEMIEAGIERTKTPYIMLWMDDYLLTNKVENDDIEYSLELAKKYNAGSMRLDRPTLSKACIYRDNTNLYKYNLGDAYSISTQVGIWNVDFWRGIVKPQWTPWDFELRGSLQIENTSEMKILGRKDYYFPYVEGVRKGKWMPQGIDLCKKYNVIIDYSKREKSSLYDILIMKIKYIIIKLNPNLVVKLQVLVKSI